MQSVERFKSSSYDELEYNQCSCLGEDQQKLYENSVQLDILIYILRKLQLNLLNGWGVVAFINLSLIGEAI